MAGAEFGIDAKKIFLTHEEVIVKADNYLEKAVSGEDGRAVFDVDLPFGTYYIKELAAPAGYVSSLRLRSDQTSGTGCESGRAGIQLKNQPIK